MSSVLLYSGGYDSTCAWWALGRPRVFYAGGFFGPARGANAAEVGTLQKQCEVIPEFAKAVHAVDADFRPFMRQGQHDFPRDLVICVMAWAAGYDHVMFAWVKDDGTTPEWAERQAANFAKHVGMPGFKVSFPVAHLSKVELGKVALKAGASPEFIKASHSCVVSSIPCGKCKGCVGRRIALEALNV